MIFSFKSKKSYIQENLSSINEKNGRYFFSGIRDSGTDLDLKQTLSQLEAYYSVPQLFSIINYSAKTFSRNKPSEYNQRGEVIDNSKVVQLLNNPHPLYSEGEFWETFYKQKELFGGAFVYKAGSIGFLPTGLFVLPGQHLKIEVKDKITARELLEAKTIDEIIKKYILTFNGKRYEIDPQDVWAVWDNSLKFTDGNYVKPESKLEAIHYPINNLYQQYKARHTILSKRGALGAWVNETMDEVGHVPITNKQEVQDEFNSMYNLQGGFTQIITDAKLKWVSSTPPIKDMQLIEGIKEDKIALCDQYQFPILLLNELSGSTYSNMGIADKNLYTKKIIPDWDNVAKSVKTEFNLADFKFKTDWIEALKPDKNKESTSAQRNSQTIIQILTNVSSGLLTSEAAKFILMREYNFTENEVNEML
jgi:hypothetical protein